MPKKIMFDCSNETWDKVKMFALENHIDLLNDALNVIVEKGLKK